MKHILNVEGNKNSHKGGRIMCRQKGLFRALGLIVLSFGCGILLAFFLPTYFLAILEAMVIIASGLLYLLQK